MHGRCARTGCRGGPASRKCGLLFQAVRCSPQDGPNIALIFPLVFPHLSIVLAPVRGSGRFFIKCYVLFCVPKENQKSTAFPRRGHGKGAARPFQTPKKKSKRKNASRFAKRIFLVSPIYGFADGVTSYRAQLKQYSAVPHPTATRRECVPPAPSFSGGCGPASRGLPMSGR